MLWWCRGRRTHFRACKIEQPKGVTMILGVTGADNVSNRDLWQGAALPTFRSYFMGWVLKRCAHIAGAECHTAKTFTFILPKVGARVQWLSGQTRPSAPLGGRDLATLAWATRIPQRVEGIWLIGSMQVACPCVRPPRASNCCVLHHHSMPWSPDCISTTVQAVGATAWFPLRWACSLQGFVRASRVRVASGCRLLGSWGCRPRARRTCGQQG